MKKFLSAFANLQLKSVPIYIQSWANTNIFASLSIQRQGKDALVLKRERQYVSQMQKLVYFPRKNSKNLPTPSVVELFHFDLSPIPGCQDAGSETASSSIVQQTIFCCKKVVKNSLPNFPGLVLITESYEYKCSYSTGTKEYI